MFFCSGECFDILQCACYGTNSRTDINPFVIQHSSYSEISGLGIHITIQEDVALFYIQMDNISLVQVTSALCYPLNQMEA